MLIKVLGSGCANCKTTVHLIEAVLKENGRTATVEKVEDYPAIMRYGVMSTPAVVVDELVVHSGSVPKKEQILGWLNNPKPADCCAPAADQNANTGCCSGGSCG